MSFPSVYSDQQSTTLPPLLVRLFSMTVMIPLFRDPFWGVTVFLASYHGCYFSLFSKGIFICLCEENTGRHFKGFYFIKNT